MSDSYQLIQGTKPLLVSIPHNGSAIPEDILCNMEPSAAKSVDTDWFLDKLYHFVIELGCSVIVPKYSRYVIDLNRPEDDQNLYPGADTTGLCPINQFDFSPLYKPGCEPDAQEKARRVEAYWRPYHTALRDELERIKDNFGFALLFEAHSIKSEVPRFFEGKLPEFNFGNNNGESSDVALLNLLQALEVANYQKVVNGRFKGGYITRAYGVPDDGVESLQLELSQATYMDESSLEFDQEKANQVTPVLKNMINELIAYTSFRIKEINATS